MSLASPKTEWALESATASGVLQPVPDLPPAYLDEAAGATQDTLARRLNDLAIRALDALAAAVLLLALLPLIVTAAVLVRLESPGPAFYRAERVGFRGRRLLMLKFRKMRSDAAGLKLTVVGDERFTRIGGILARLKIDEIPQLWHVLKGEMSLVGPRPEDASYVTLHHDPYQEILSVRPGITGLSQIAFADESRILDLRNPHDHYVGRILPQKIALDSLYAERRTLWLNLRILFWTTAAVVMRRDVAVNRASGRMNLRRR
jgi:lipopolysaccharide/colanic/teichoic acid biosynthesis glycosyltransferase